MRESLGQFLETVTFGNLTAFCRLQDSHLNKPSISGSSMVLDKTYKLEIWNSGSQDALGTYLEISKLCLIKFVDSLNLEGVDGDWG